MHKLWNRCLYKNENFELPTAYSSTIHSLCLVVYTDYAHIK